MQDERNPKEVYLKLSCNCGTECNIVSKSLITKALQLLFSYPAIPSGSFLSNTYELRIEDLLDIRKKFIVDHNAVVKLYKSKDAEHSSRYFYLDERCNDAYYKS